MKSDFNTCLSRIKHDDKWLNNETILEMNVFMTKIFISHIFKICKYEYLKVIQYKQPT